MDWSYLLYAATFIPLLLIVLVVHEGGHYLVARACRLHIAGFQIGLGPALLAKYSGQTIISLPAGQAIPCLNRKETPPAIGEKAIIAVESNSGQPGQLQGAAWLPAHRKDWPVIDQHPDNPPLNTCEARDSRLNAHSQATRRTSHQAQIQGKLLDLTPERAVIAPTAFTLRPIPLAAGVLLPEDPTGRIPGFYNNASWLTRMALIFAGPLANLALMFFALFLLTLLPPPSLQFSLLEITEIEANSPAHRAGARVGDRIIAAGTSTLPNLQQLQDARNKAADNNGELLLVVNRGDAEAELKVTGLRPDEGLGLALEARPSEQRSYPRSPQEAFDRFARLNVIYYQAFSQLAQINRDTLNNLSSPVMVTHQTAQVVRLASWPAWLSILAAVSVSAALLNLIPIPPMDGYRLVTETIRSLRHGKTLNPRIEGIILFYGVTTIILAALYLVFRDLVKLLP